MKKLSNTKAGFKKIVAYKKSVYNKFEATNKQI